MKTNELHVGNMVRVLGIISPIVSISGTRIKVNVSGKEVPVNIDDCGFIKVNDDLLKEIGFIKEGDLLALKRNGGPDFYIRTESSWVGSSKSFRVIFNGKDASFDNLYLHQLQNIYLDRTGEELKYNPMKNSRLEKQG